MSASESDAIEAKTLRSRKKLAKSGEGKRERILRGSLDSAESISARP